jgi:hypothetical protein
MEDRTTGKIDEFAKGVNIIELLCQFDDYLISNVLLEMEPIQMTIFGGLSQFNFICVRS